MADTVVVLEPGEERAQKIAKAMASQTAGDILRFIGDGQKTSTEISEALSLPMNTAKYHIENLLDAGLISVASTKYSVKGREVKVYTLTNQLLIVAPRQATARSLLLKYASLFGIVAFGSLVIAMLPPLLTTAGASSGGLNSAPQMAMEESAPAFQKAAFDAAIYNYSGNGEMVTAASREIVTGTGLSNTTPPAPDIFTSVVQGSADVTSHTTGTLSPDLAVAFLLGGILVILVLLCYEVSVWRKMKRQ